MRPVAVVGLGLMGGSLLRALSAAGREAVGWGPEPGERIGAAGLKGVRVPDRLAEALEGVEGVVVATPLSVVTEVLEAVAGSPGTAWVTDLASLQRPPLQAAAACGIRDRYVTSHPMVGGHRSGFGASREEMYRGAPVWLSAASEGTPREAVAAFWEGVGAHPAWVAAAEHDQRMAWASHLPQVVSTHLAAVLVSEGVSRAALGPGGRDVTRLAGSDPTMWRDLLEVTPSPLPQALRKLAAELAREADRLEEGDPSGFTERLRATGDWSRE